MHIMLKLWKIVCVMLFASLGKIRGGPPVVFTVVFTKNTAEIMMIIFFSSSHNPYLYIYMSHLLYEQAIIVKIFASSMVFSFFVVAPLFFFGCCAIEMCYYGNNMLSTTGEMRNTIKHYERIHMEISLIAAEKKTAVPVAVMTFLW